jgi:hypothetical protein
MRAIATLEDLKAAQRGFCAILFAFSPNALRLTPNAFSGEGVLWALAGGANTRTIQRRGSQKK